MDCHADVRAGVLSEEVKLADDGTIVPFVISGSTMFVRMKNLVGGGVACFAIRETDLTDDGIN